MRAWSPRGRHAGTGGCKAQVSAPNEPHTGPGLLRRGQRGSLLAPCPRLLHAHPASLLTRTAPVTTRRRHGLRPAFPSQGLRTTTSSAQKPQPCRAVCRAAALPVSRVTQKLQPFRGWEQGVKLPVRAAWAALATFRREREFLEGRDQRGSPVQQVKVDETAHRLPAWNGCGSGRCTPAWHGHREGCSFCVGWIGLAGLVCANRQSLLASGSSSTRPASINNIKPASIRGEKVLLNQWVTRPKVAVFVLKVAVFVLKVALFVKTKVAVLVRQGCTFWAPRLHSLCKVAVFVQFREFLNSDNGLSRFSTAEGCSFCDRRVLALSRWFVVKVATPR